jgi:hypothetical protein
MEDNTIIYVAASRTRYDSNKVLHYLAVSTYFTEKDKEEPFNITEFNKRASLYNFKNLQYVNVVNEKIIDGGKTINAKSAYFVNQTFYISLISFFDFFTEDFMNILLPYFETRDFIFRFEGHT